MACKHGHFLPAPRPPPRPVSHPDDEMSTLMVAQVEAPRAIEGDVEGRFRAGCLLVLNNMSGPG